MEDSSTEPQRLAARESPSPPSSGEGSLPPPARGGARLRLAALLVLGLGCLATAWQLRGAAAYALGSAGPRDLGNLSNASLDAPGASGRWVRGVGSLEHDAVAFARRGERGSLVLGRVKDRHDLWVLLPVPTSTVPYFPPRVMEGRLLSRPAMGLRLHPVLQLMRARGSSDHDHLLVVGSRPNQHRLELVLMLLLVALGIVASVRFAQLALPASSAARSS